MKTTETKPVIRYKTNFYVNDKPAHQSDCDFEIVQSRIDFSACKILNDIFLSDVKKKFDINSITSVDMNIETLDGVVPKSLADAKNICKVCPLKHRECEAG